MTVQKPTGRFRRITSSGGWIPEIDGLRCFAILAVLLVHVLGQTVYHLENPKAVVSEHADFLRAMNHLSRGVELFFVISGYILAQPFLRHFLDGTGKVDLKAFYLRRVTRLEPPYVLSLLLYGLAMLVFRSSKLSTVLCGLLTHLAYVHNFFPQVLSLNPPTWRWRSSFI